MTESNLTLFIDLDGTVYDKKNGIWEEMSARIDHYLVNIVGLPEQNLSETKDFYYQKYGSTLRGVQLHHNIDSEEYLAFIHDLNLEKYLSRDEELRNSLKSLPYPKWIFTNADRNHAKRVLQLVGIEDLFEGILDVWAMNYVPKPSIWTYLNALSLTGNPESRNCVFVDDTLKNLYPAYKMGWQTVWVDSYTRHPHANFSMPKLHYLPDVIGQIETNAWLNWAYTQKSQVSKYEVPNNVETR
jgi:putative hydrolase of the HAD superfamily